MVQEEGFPACIQDLRLKGKNDIFTLWWKTLRWMELAGNFMAKQFFIGKCQFDPKMFSLKYLGLNKLHQTQSRDVRDRPSKEGPCTGKVGLLQQKLKLTKASVSLSSFGVQGASVP